MAFYVVQYAYTTDSSRIDELRPSHREYLRSLAERGILRASGPFVEAPSPSALFVYYADHEDDVRACVEDDPFQKADLVQAWSVTQWNPVIGVFASEAG